MAGNAALIALNCRSPRWPSGHSRMLLELYLGFESHVSRTFEFILAKIKNQRNQLRRAPSSVGRRSSMRVDEGRKGWRPSRTRDEGACVEKSLLGEPGSELRLGRQKEESKCEDNRRDGKKKEERKMFRKVTWHTLPSQVNMSGDGQSKENAQRSVKDVKPIVHTKN